MAREKKKKGEANSGCARPEHQRSENIAINPKGRLRLGNEGEERRRGKKEDINVSHLLHDVDPERPCGLSFRRRDVPYRHLEGREERETKFRGLDADRYGKEPVVHTSYSKVAHQRRHEGGSRKKGKKKKGEKNSDRSARLGGWPAGVSCRRAPARKIVRQDRKTGKRKGERTDEATYLDCRREIMYIGERESGSL